MFLRQAEASYSHKFVKNNKSGKIFKVGGMSIDRSRIDSRVFVILTPLKKPQKASNYEFAVYTPELEKEYTILSADYSLTFKNLNNQLAMAN